MRRTHFCIMAMFPVVLLAAPGSVSGQVTVSVNNEGSFTEHTVTAYPLDSFRIAINVSTPGQIFDVGGMKLLAGAANVFTVTGGTVHAPWIGPPLGIPTGPLDPISEQFDVVLPYPDMFGPGETTLATIELSVNGSAPPGIYALNIVEATWMDCRICPAFSYAESGPDFFAYVLPEDCADGGDRDCDGVPDCLDGCPDDPSKTDPGQSGCGLGDAGDSDGDGAPDCRDRCPGVDDAIFAPGCLDVIPTVSGWGLAVLSLLLLTAGKLFTSARAQAPPQASH